MPDAEAVPAASTIAGTIETMLRHAVEIPAAGLVLAEIGVLLAGVVSRFVLQHPFVWTDELASILFLWLAMFGAVVALQRGQHMRLTAVVAAMSPAWQARMQVLAVAVPALFLLLVLPWARDYAEDEWFIETPSLGLSNIVRAGAIPVGCALMLLTAPSGWRGAGWPTCFASARRWRWWPPGFGSARRNCAPSVTGTWFFSLSSCWPSRCCSGCRSALPSGRPRSPS